MSSEDASQTKPSFPKHTKKEDCPLCKHNREVLGITVPTCYESASRQAGEQTKRF